MFYIRRINNYKMIITMTDLAYLLADLDKNEYIEPLTDELLNL